MQLGLVVPDGLPGPSGGSVYNDRLSAALVDAGHSVAVHRVPGAWPNASPDDHRDLTVALSRCATALVDGIMASAAPEAIRTAVRAGTTVWVLLHLPLPAETGLTERAAGAFAASEETALRIADGVICTSSWARDDLRRRYRLSNVFAVPPGTSPAAVAAGSNPPHFLMLASLIPRKNHAIVLSALAQVADLPWTAAFAGPGGYDGGGGLGDGGKDRYDGGNSHARMLRSMASRDFEPGRIIFPGVLEGRARDVEWARTDLLLLPSLAETFGMVVTEGLARGVPGVVSAGTGAVEALSGGTSGVLPGAASDALSGGAGRPLPGDTPGQLPGAVVGPHDPQKLAVLLRHWLTDTELRDSWRKTALQRRDTLRTWANTATDLLQIVHP